MPHPHPLSLDHVTIGNVTPPELIRIAAICGCTMVNMRIHPGRLALPYDFIGDAQLQRDTRDIAHDLGITIGIAESYNLGPEVKMESFDRGLEVAASIGAQYVNAHGMDPDRKRQVDSFAAFCERATRYGLGVTLEFFKRSKTDSLQAALELVRATPRATLMVDTLHVVRCGNTPEQIAALTRDEPQRIGWVQLNDGPATVTPEYMDTEGRFHRLIPGEGAFPLRALMSALPPGVPIGVEVPSQATLDAGTTPEAWARKVVDASRRLLESFGVALLTR
jgi:sugar phosphate isomerase/epimerase